MRDYEDFVVRSLVEEGRLTGDAVEKARQHASEHRGSLSDALAALGLVSNRELAIATAVICEAPFVDIAAYDVDYRNAARLPRSVAERFVAFPLFDLGQTVTVGMVDPLDLKAVDQIRGMLKAEVEAVLCEREALSALIARAYSLTAGQDGQAKREQASDLTTGEEPIVAAVNHLIAQAAEEGASDVHIGPDEKELHVRFRIDGALQRRQGPSLSAHQGIIQRLKVMARLDLTQSRRPQDGKFRYVHNGRPIDIRLSIIPTVCGENAVLRLLVSGAVIKGFAELGIPAAEREQIEELIESPHGMILVSGPTGSGKTTTLYTALKRLNSPDRNLMTIEDPVEVRLPMIRQIQVNGEVGLTFAGALRSILRQDPDVVLVGEIRDDETARIALQAALTGHLVLSTLHTNDAPGAVARLLDFGCPAFAINAAVLAVIAQRLVRRVCDQCAGEHEADARVLRRFGLAADGHRFVAGRGCGRCSSTGYHGRIGVYELLRMTPAVQDAVESEGSTEEVRRAAASGGMRPMWLDGLEKAKMGLTTPEEVARVVAVQEVACGKAAVDAAEGPRITPELRQSA